MKLVKSILFILVIVGYFVSCASSGGYDVKDIPDFYLNPPSAEDAVYGVGDAKMSTLSMSRTMALSRARDDVARQVEGMVKNAITDYAQEAGAGKGAQVINFAETVSRQIVEITLNGVKTKEVSAGKDGTIYAMVEYSASTFMDDAANVFERSEEAAFAEFKAGQALDKLNFELKNNPTRAGGN